MTLKRKINLVLVDDHHMFLQGLTALLQDIEHINIIGTAANGAEVASILEDNLVDMVVTDIGMPEMDGIELNNAIKKKFPTVKTLILSTYNDPDKISKLIKNGVNGYLLKNAEKSELLTAIDSIVRGENYFAENVKKKYMESIFSMGQDEEAPQLSRREKEILKLIAEEFTTQEIATKLFISEHTVNTHRKNLLSKLSVKNTAGLVKCAFQLGIIE